MIPKPMLAEKLDKGVIADYADWVAEVKYDGHRGLFDVVHLDSVTAWSRPSRKGEKKMAPRPLPAHLISELVRLPTGLYDGEDMAGETATDVKRLDLAHERRVVLFDILRLGARSTMGQTCDERREMLESIHAHATKIPHVALSVRMPLRSQRDVIALTKTVWKTGGEGLILKRRAAIYQNKRSTDWLKIKKLEHFTLRVVGFQPTRGEVMNRGPFAIVVLRDDDGNETTCKTKDDHELDAFTNQMQTRLARMPLCTTLDRPSINHDHPALGRRLVIECGGRTRSGGYKGPVIWDRWEDE